MLTAFDSLINDMIWSIKLYPNGAVFTTRDLVRAHECQKGLYPDSVLRDIHDALMKAAEKEGIIIISNINDEIMPWDKRFYAQKPLHERKNVKRITIEFEPFFYDSETRYSEKLVVMKGSIRYEYSPLFSSKENPARRWSCFSDDNGFQNAFIDLDGLVQAVLDNKDYLEHTDFGITDIVVDYEDDTHALIEYRGDSEELCSFLLAIKRMVPVKAELMPKVLNTFVYGL